MMAMAQAGFVFLSTTKTGSTAIQRHFARQSQIIARRPPGMKHMTASTFELMIAPLLERYGHPRDTYETVCLVREPVDWAASWWRYRSRPEMQRRHNSTVGMSFEDFALRIVDGSVDVGSHHHFATDRDGLVIVDQVWKYEHLDALAAWMAERLGMDPAALKRTNASPERAGELTAGTRAALEEHYRREMELYETAR